MLRNKCFIRKKSACAGSVIVHKSVIRLLLKFAWIGYSIALKCVQLNKGTEKRRRKKQEKRKKIRRQKNVVRIASSQEMILIYRGAIASSYFKPMHDEWKAFAWEIMTPIGYFHAEEQSTIRDSFCLLLIEILMHRLLLRVGLINVRDGDGIVLLNVSLLIGYPPFIFRTAGR